jgi:hypothetical protein
MRNSNALYGDLIGIGFANAANGFSAINIGE